MLANMYFHHLKDNAYISTAFEVMKISLLFYCVTLLWALHIFIKQQFFYTFICSFYRALTH